MTISAIQTTVLEKSRSIEITYDDIVDLFTDLSITPPENVQFTVNVQKRAQAFLCLLDPDQTLTVTFTEIEVQEDT